METRPATLEDRELIWRWANDPETRAVSFDRSEIPWAEHIAWFDRVLNDPAQVLLVGCAPEAIGVVRFDLASDEATVSVNLAPSARGRRLGTALIARATAWFQQHYPMPVTAWIRPSNTRSIAAFQQAGYRPMASTTADRLRYVHPGSPTEDA